MAVEAIPTQQAELLRNDYNVKIHCIGVTSKVDKSQLQEIASKPLSEHLFFIEDYGELSLLVQTITRQKLGEMYSRYFVSVYYSSNLEFESESESPVSSPCPESCGLSSSPLKTSNEQRKPDTYQSYGLVSHKLY